ncbi:hypothetical protein CMK19_01855 [Candidatus Poribacteria bacterium]|nr:hypothetical protein [Candidatus Poribacteria bacterium]
MKNLKDGSQCLCSGGFGQEALETAIGLRKCIDEEKRKSSYRWKTELYPSVDTFKDWALDFTFDGDCKFGTHSRE